jgi:hypothetical protein
VILIELDVKSFRSGDRLRWRLQMDNSQILTIALAAVPTMLTVLVGILINNARLNDLRDHMNSQFTSVDRRFDAVDHRFDGVDGRFDEMRDLWRSKPGARVGAT